MPDFSKSIYNPNPITKFIATFILGLTVIDPINPYFEWAIVVLISFLFFCNGYKKDAVKGILVFGILFSLPNYMKMTDLNPILKIFLSFPTVMRMFILPYMGGKFMIKTSDVGTILSSMDKIKIPKSISIPIAVMFRYFPAYMEEKKNVKLAMKIRGITAKNPIQYIEYVLVPLLIISSTIADDIAKAAETKAIENPIKKTGYIPVTLQAIDFIYPVLILIFIVGGRI